MRMEPGQGLERRGTFLFRILPERSLHKGADNGNQRLGERVRALLAETHRPRQATGPKPRGRLTRVQDLLQHRPHVHVERGTQRRQGLPLPVVQRGRLGDKEMPEQRLSLLEREAGTELVEGVLVSPCRLGASLARGLNDLFRQGGRRVPGTVSPRLGARCQAGGQEQQTDLLNHAAQPSPSLCPHGSPPLFS